MSPFSTRKQLIFTVCRLLASITCFTVGAHLSYSNVAPQQARTQARNQYVRARLRQFLKD